MLRLYSGMGTNLWIEYQIQDGEEVFKLNEKPLTRENEEGPPNPVCLMLFGFSHARLGPPNVLSLFHLVYVCEG